MKPPVYWFLVPTNPPAELAAALAGRYDLRRTLGQGGTARLTHPHILALYDSGEAAGFLYYVMPYLPEPSLRQRLATTGRLGTHEALTIAERVADALTYAHRMGILHRPAATTTA